MKELIELAKYEPKKFKKRINRARRNAYFQGYYEGVTAVLDSDDVVLDIGAGLGETTQKFGQTDAVILAYEADPLLAERLVSKMKTYENVTVMPVAVGIEGKQMKLYRTHKFDASKPKTAIQSSLIAFDELPYIKGTQITVHCEDIKKVMIDAVKKYGKISFVNIDILGCELEVLETIIASDIKSKFGQCVAKSYEKRRPREKDRYEKIIDQIAEHPEWNIVIDRA